MPIWRDSEILYLKLTPRVSMSIPVSGKGHDTTFGQPTPVLANAIEFTRGSGFDVTPDGKQLLMLKGARSPGATLLNVTVDWADEVRRKLSESSKAK